MAWVANYTPQLGCFYLGRNLAALKTLHLSPLTPLWRLDIAALFFFDYGNTVFYTTGGRLSSPQKVDPNLAHLTPHLGPGMARR